MVYFLQDLFGWKPDMTTTEEAITALSEDNNWDMVIEPQRGLFELRLGDLWRYKDLAR